MFTITVKGWNNKMTKIISIDPGYERLGIAVIEKEGSKNTLLFSECFKTSAKLEFTERLHLLGERVEEIIKKYKPRALAIEKLYFENNQKTAMQVAEVRGALIYIAMKTGLEVFEYTPLQIKVAVTGYGKSDKKAIAMMVPKLIHIQNSIESDDEMDAVACGLTCLACEKL